MGITERLEEKLDSILALLQSGQSSPLTDFTADAAQTIQGTAPQVAAPVVASGDVELDAQGFPWVETIHASSKEKVVAGTWKYKRGVEQHVKDSVENELRAAGYGRKDVGVSPVPSTGQQSTNPVVPQQNVSGGEQPVAVPQPAAQVAPGGVSLPGLSLPVAPAAAVAPEPVRIVMPAYVEGAELDDSQMTAIAAALYAKVGEPAYLKVITDLFKMAPGTAITDLPTEFRDSFHRVASDDTVLKHYGII